MQSKSSKIQTRPIEDLLGRIRTLRQQGQPQIIITAAEADRLADSLSQVMTRMVTIQEEIIEALKTAQQAQTINIEMDGGEFDNEKNNLEDLLEIIYPSKSINSTFNSVQEKYNYIADLKAKESKVTKQFLKLSNSDVLLDYGVGLGFITEHLNQFVAKTYCYDTDHRMLQYCNEKFIDEDNVQCITNLKNITPNKITINHVFAEHYSFIQFQECMKTLYNILTPKGLVWLDFFDLEQKNDTNKHLNKNFYSLKKTIFTLQQIGFKPKLVDSRNVHIKIVVEKL